MGSGRSGWDGESTLMRDDDEATPTLEATDMAIVARLGERRQAQAGEYLYREGDFTYDFFVRVDA
jgi:thioredoxin reductase (NADPH)